MSVKLMGQVFYMPGLSASEKLTLLALADHADDTGSCWPSMATIAEKSCQSERNTRRMIRRLQDLGLIAVEAQDGRSNRYIVTPTPDNLSAPEPRTICPPTPDKAVSAPPDKAVSAEPSRTIKEPRENISPTPRGVLSVVLSKETAKAVVDHRQRIGKPLTAEAARRMAKELEKCPDPEAAVNEMLLRGWRGFKAEWVAPKDTPSRVDPRKVLGLP